MSQRRPHCPKSALPIVKSPTACNTTVSSRIKIPPVTGTMMELSDGMNGMLAIAVGMNHENRGTKGHGTRTTREDQLGSHPPALSPSGATTKGNEIGKPSGGVQAGEMDERVEIPKIEKRTNQQENQTTVGTNVRGQEESENPRAEEDPGSMKETGRPMRKSAELDQGMGMLL